MKQIKDIVISSVFLLFIAVTMLLLVFLPKTDFSQNEKRYLAVFPDVTWETVADGSFGRQIENYINDHIAGRELYIAVNAYFDLLMGRNTSKDVYYCKKGYLINCPKDKDTSQFEKNLNFFQQFSSAIKIPSSFIMIPTTGYIMKDMLPLGHETYQDDRLYDSAEAILRDVSVIDVRDVLKAEKKRQVCYRTDHHLTAYGNYLAYREFLQQRQKAYYKENEFQIKQEPGFYGTTWSASGYRLVKPDVIEMWNRNAPIKVTVTETDNEISSDSLFFYDRLNNADKYPVYLDGNHSLVTIENDAAENGTILILKDSYAQCFATFLAHNYRKVYMIDMRYYRAPVSEFIENNNVDELLYLYGVSSLLSDTNSAWIR